MSFALSPFSLSLSLYLSIYLSFTLAILTSTKGRNFSTVRSLSINEDYLLIPSCTIVGLTLLNDLFLCCRSVQPFNYLPHTHADSLYLSLTLTHTQLHTLVHGSTHSQTDTHSQ